MHYTSACNFPVPVSPLGTLLNGYLDSTGLGGGLGVCIPNLLLLGLCFEETGPKNLSTQECFLFVPKLGSLGKCVFAELKLTGTHQQQADEASAVCVMSCPP